MKSPKIPKKIVETIIESELSPIRFEDFCCDLFSIIHQCPFLGTSKSYDLARDGRTPPDLNTGKCVFLCCTIGVELEQKFVDDITRMLKFATPSAVYFCSTQLASESLLNDIKDEIKKHIPSNIIVEAFGGIQFSNLILHSADTQSLFEHRYAANLLEYTEYLLHADANPSNAGLGLRIALSTQFHEDSIKLRTELLENFVLTSLADQKPKGVRDLAVYVSDQLFLPRSVDSTYLSSVLSELVDKGVVTADPENGAYKITETGLSVYSRIQEAGNAGLTNARICIRKTIDGLLGENQTESAFEQLWNQLQDELVTLFYAQGIHLVQTIASLTQAGSEVLIKKTFSELLDAVRRRIIKSGAGGPRSESVAQAVIDLFAERGSDAFNWINELAIKYVCMCSLGFEPTAQQEVVGKLREIKLILDTDVILSLLSIGERPHDGIVAILKRWKLIGGSVLITEPVLQEATYHAWISEFEMTEIGVEKLMGYSASEMPRYVKNAFVRGFYCKRKEFGDGVVWDKFISEYRGANKNDSSRIESILEDEGFEIIKNAEIDKGVASVCRDIIFELRGLNRPNSFISKQVGDKTERDGWLLGFLKAKRDEMAGMRYSTIVIVSSSTLLRAAACATTGAFEGASPVWPIGALGYLVSLVPGVHMTTSSLRGCLFDESDYDTLDKITHFAMRVISQSNQYNIGYSHRATLRRELKDRINTTAQQRGQRPAELTEDLFLGTSSGAKEKLVDIVADSIDAIQASKSEIEMDKLKAALRGSKRTF